MTNDEVAALCARVVARDRRALAQAITLVESTRVSDRVFAHALLDAVAPSTGGAMRIGLSGTPGAGKSTLIERLGLSLIQQGHRIAVLAVDPSSPKSGGSLLGDKTRMEVLAQHEAAYVRPQPSGGTLGGTAPHTRDALLLCEAAGFDVVLVETVGVGQSEAAVRDMVDTFVLMLAPAGGDALQSVKRGVLELCDVIVVNKADGDLEQQALQTQRDYQNGSHMLLRLDDTTAPTPEAAWVVPVLAISAKTGAGVDALWHSIERHRASLDRSQRLPTLRQNQAVRAMWNAVDHALAEEARVHPDGRVLAAQVLAGTCTPHAAATRMVQALVGRRPVSLAQHGT